MVELAAKYGCYGYRRVATPLRAECLAANHKRVDRRCRREGLKVPQSLLKRGRLCPGIGS
jgi:hypothetical protein